MRKEGSRPLHVLAVRYSQGDDVSVGVVHSDGYGVLVVLVPGIVIGPALQEEAHQPAATARRNRKLTDGAGAPPAPRKHLVLHHIHVISSKSMLLERNGLHVNCEISLPVFLFS